MTVGPFIVSIDPEPAVRTALLAALPTFGESFPVTTHLPNPRPPEFVRIILAGGPRETFVTDAFRILVEAWADSDGRAARMLNVARAVLLAQNGPTLFGVSEYAGPTNLPDPTTDQARYTAALVVRARATPTA